MLMVAPKGSTKEEMFWLTCILRMQSMVRGRVPEEEQEEKAKREAGAIPLKNAIGFIFARMETKVPYTMRAWWTTQNGVKGYKVTGTNGNSIFLPAAGYRYGATLYDSGSNGFYWSSSLYEGNSYNAYRLYFYSGYYVWSYGSRYRGFSVRPVSE